MKLLLRMAAMLLLAVSVSMCFFACEKDKKKDEPTWGGSLDEPIQTPWGDV